MKANAILIRYAEVFLKGGRKPYFLARMKESIERQVRKAGPFRVRELYGFFIVYREGSPKGEPLPDLGEEAALAVAMDHVFGVANWAPCRLVTRTYEAIAEEVGRIADEDMRGTASFRIEAQRTVKDFPINSMELNRRLGGVVLERIGPVPVKMKDPATTLFCRILPKEAALFTEDRKGPGGLPVGGSGHLMLLLSGGIDSPVAGWMAMRRGCTLDAVHYDAAPYTTPQARKKVEDLAGMLAAYEASLRLHVVPFGAVQADLRDAAPGRLLVVLYRRMMVRIACRLAAAAGAQALVTGENLAQVASQTLENLAVIEAVTDRPILRPLVCFDKEETVRIARRIGTYETSIRPYEDCCSLFVPDHPETAARKAYVEEIEKKIDVDGMVASAVAATEVVEIKSA